MTGADDLCVSGGVGLNSVVNGMMQADTPFTRLFVTPAAGDSGVAIGAALYGHRQLTGARAHWRSYDNYHGNRYVDDEVRAALTGRSRFIRVEPVPDPVEPAARDLVAGRFVGWFEGGSEFGPRALGHRSILCDPRPSDMRDRLNAVVKFREPFRPYAASVLTEHVKDFFDVVDDDPFMMTVVRVRPSQRDAIASVCHVDGTCRIQTVNRDHPGDYRRLIERFHDITGMPLVLNTSFNVRGEPIVETPDDAIRCFLSCNLDVLYLQGYRITKHLVETDAAAQRLVPHLNDAVTIEATFGNDHGAAVGPSYCCRTRTGQRSAISAADFALLTAIDGSRCIADLAELCADPVDDVVRDVVELQRRGLVCLASPTA